MEPNTPKPMISRARRVYSGSAKNSAGIWRSKKTPNFRLQLSTNDPDAGGCPLEDALAAGGRWPLVVELPFMFEKEVRFVPNRGLLPLRSGNWWSAQSSGG